VIALATPRSSRSSTAHHCFATSAITRLRATRETRADAEAGQTAPAVGIPRFAKSRHPVDRHETPELVQGRRERSVDTDARVRRESRRDALPSVWAHCSNVTDGETPHPPSRNDPNAWR